MRRLFALIFFAAALAAPAPANERTKVKVVIDPTADGATVRFTFDRPVGSFRLNYPEEGIRDRSWKIATPGITRHNTLLTAADGTSFDTIAIDVQAWNERTEAVYPCLFRVGAHGMAFYADYFVGITAEFETTLEIADAPDRIVEGFPRAGKTWRIDDTFHGDGGHRYVYIGKRGDVVESAFARFVLPEGLAPGLRKRIRDNVDGIMKYYRRQFAREVRTKPLILLAPNREASQQGLQGDVTGGPAVALRIFGERLTTTFDPKSDRMDHFIAHEAAHFWNSGTSHAPDNAPAWLWEGSAEVMALAARVAVTGRLTHDGRRDHIEQSLNTCVEHLLARPLETSRSNATYFCGETLFWLADAAEKTRTKGRGDIFAIWRRILDAAEANGGIYTPERVFAEAAPTDDIKHAFDVFLGREGTERWWELPARAKPLGIDLAAKPADDRTLRRQIIWHLLDLYCIGSRGMWTEDDHLKLDTGDRCGPLNGDPEVDTLNGFSLYANLPAARAAAEEACRTNGDITLTRTGQPQKVTAPCTKPLPPALPKFRIVATP